MIWCQEEPRNQGAWAFVQPYLEWVLEQTGGVSKRARYVGRAASAATATGLMSSHLKQLKTFLDEALGLGESGDKRWRPRSGYRRSANP